MTPAVLPVVARFRPDRPADRLRTVITCDISAPIAEIVVSKPPTNALSVADLHTLREMFQALSADESISVVVLRADGPGFSSGIDYKEFQTPFGRELLLDSGLACRDTVAAVRACAVPVVVAVQGYCRGAGVALVAGCDVVLAADDATFALPDGAWSVAHFARMLPPMKLRQAVLACEVVPAETLTAYGSVHHLVPPRELIREARAVAHTLSGQGRRNLAAAKARLNLIDPFDADAMFWHEQAQVLASSVADLTSRQLHRTRPGEGPRTHR